MKRFLLMLCFLTAAAPALAQRASPIQEYLQNETGYMPPMEDNRTAVATPAYPPQPYAVAQTPQPYPAPAPAYTAPADTHSINSGVVGMNY